MSKTIKNQFYKNLTFQKLYEAHMRARLKKTHKPEIIQFELNLENNLTNLLHKIQNHTYRLGKYYTFTLYEPKKRIIAALPYQDRIVHQWYVKEFMIPYIVPRFISNTFACLEDRGTHSAACRIQEYMREYEKKYGNYWILKCDIRKFFYSIDPYILFQIMHKYISDKELLRFTKLLIFDSRLPNEKIGIPIGNYTSQFFANTYLNELDQYIKHVLHVRAYVRYMDDFILLLHNKAECIAMKQKIENFLAEKLHLSLNDKSRYFPSKMGVNFCGYRIFPTHRLLRTSSKTKIKNKIRKWNQLYESNSLNTFFAIQSLNSWLGHASHCNSYDLRKKMLNKCHFLYTDAIYPHIEKQLIEDSISFLSNEKDLQ